MINGLRDFYMTNRILCATDFSEASKEALEWSARLAKRLNCHLTILYTYRLLKQNGDAFYTKKKMEEDGLKSFNVLEKRSSRRNGHLL
jgi:hypothetical protein